MDAPVKAGDIIDGRYRLERVIGTGGMAVVVSAIDLEVSERVALKFLFRKAARHKEILQRFEREKAVIARLRGEHVARILDSGIVKNTPYMAMEYLKGSDLADVLRVQKTLPLDHAMDYVLQACEAVAEAHSLDIVHRDLKPGNLFLTHRADGSPCIKVFDFGIAKILGGGQTEGSLTRTEVVMGSPFYMSPEQMVSSKDVGPATDIWALGVILYELLAGKLPFAAKNVEKVCARVLNDSPTPLSEVMPGCPEGLDEALRGCFQRMPDDRYRDVGELVTALAPFAPARARPLIPRVLYRLQHPGQEPPVGEAAQEIASVRDPEAAPEAPTVYLPRKSRRHRTPVLLVVFGVGMLAVGFAGGMYLRGGEPPAVPDSIPSAGALDSIGHAAASAMPTVAIEEPEEPMVPELPIEIDLDEEIRKSALEKRQEERAARRRDAVARAASSAAAARQTTPPASSPPLAPSSSVKIPPSAPSPGATSAPVPTGSSAPSLTVDSSLEEPAPASPSATSTPTTTLPEPPTVAPTSSR